MKLELVQTTVRDAVNVTLYATPILLQCYTDGHPDVPPSRSFYRRPSMFCIDGLSFALTRQMFAADVDF